VRKPEKKKKELWILLQDTAKAFDMINLDMLNKSLQRIKIPEKIIQLIVFLFKDRQFKIITAQGLTILLQLGMELIKEKQSPFTLENFL
jgi:Reverse transcriptase (RNA-dependent DNA polymerase).